MVTSTKGYTVIDRRRKPEFTKSGIAPLVETDPLELTDKRLNPEEAVIKLREEIVSAKSVKRIHGQDELEDAARSEGPRLSYQEVIRRIRKLNPGIIAKDGVGIALYYQKKPEEYTPEDQMSPAQAALFGVDLPKDQFFTHHKYISGFLKEDLPEWGSVTVDNAGLAVHEVEKEHNRGWRTVLITLIKKGILDYKAVLTEFGNPSYDQRSRFWHEELTNHKG